MRHPGISSRHSEAVSGGGRSLPALPFPPGAASPPGPPLPSSPCGTPARAGQCLRHYGDTGVTARAATFFSLCLIDHAPSETTGLLGLRARQISRQPVFTHSFLHCSSPGHLSRTQPVPTSQTGGNLTIQYPPQQISINPSKKSFYRILALFHTLTPIQVMFITIDGLSRLFILAGSSRLCCPLMLFLQPFCQTLKPFIRRHRPRLTQSESRNETEKHERMINNSRNIEDKQLGTELKKASRENS